MSKELVISATPHETRVAIVEDGQLCEIYIEREKEFALVGSLYKGRVTRVLPGMQSAFVDIGLDSDAFLYVSDFLEHLEEYDHVAAPVEHKVQTQKTEHQDSEVFPPSTTNGGVHEPAEAAASVPADLPATEPVAEPASPIIPLEGEVLHSKGAGATAPSESIAQTAPPSQHNQRPFEPRHDRGRDRGDRGGRGGRNRRWGRQGGGGRDRGPRRDLPSSKYAAPQSFESKPREAEPVEPLPADFEPIILPGESLAKYKDRAPSAPSAPQQETGTAATPAVQPLTQNEAQHPAGESTRERFESGLPSSLYAAVSPAVPQEPLQPAPAAPALSEKVTEEVAEKSIAVPQFAAPPITPEPETIPAAAGPESGIAEHREKQTNNGASMSDEEVSNLAEQLAEAKHEEAQAEAEDREESADTALEPFVDASEIEDLQEALHQDHEDDQENDREDDHEDAAAEAESVADEMHEEALAAEESSEHAEDQSEVRDAEQEGAHDAVETTQASGEQQPTSARISDRPRARFQRPMRRGGRNQRGGGRRGGRPNDHRPHQQPSHGHPRHEQHKRPQLISEMLKAGEEIIVQIAKEPLGKKGARITSHVALPGRYLVYMPTVDHIGVSRRIGSAEDRSRLRRVVTEAKGTFPGGFIVRTAAAEASDDEIRADVEFLGRTWDTIRGVSEQRRAPSLLHRDLNLVERILRDYLSDDYVAIWLDNEEEFTKVVEFVSRFQPKMVPRVKLYTKEAPIFEEFGIQQELDKALRPKVWLKSGGYIVINHTEALVAIDVNTGKYVGRGSTRLEDTIVKTNLEAVKEIVRQIRLRDLGGIIVCDFIDMEERRNRDKVMAALDQTLNQDRAPSKALSFNEFGLVCITRKRTKQALERVLCQPCPYCTGSGMVKSIPTICYEIQAEARKMSVDMDARSLTLRVNPEIAKALKTRESSLIDELEQATRKSIIIQSDPTLHWEQYDIY
ncbi:MAG TPA: Rne/Rng family ribonuclease [Candidatus Dormibacteraeota bacterium]|nr:Rne/Rng family ribonuclease [Candidatus Dormibacteraeota bacterium]